MRNDKKVEIFLATPKDVQREKEKAVAIVSRVNREVSDALGISLEVISWDTKAIPGMGRAQSRISPLVDECDIFVGILCHRFGSPPGTTGDGSSYESGTEEEFYRAFDRWEKNGGQNHSLPHSFVYFSEKHFPQDVDLDQVKKVSEFKSRFATGGRHPGLFSTYKTLQSFEQLFHQHLLHILFALSGGTSRSEVVADFVELPPEEWTNLFKSSTYIYVLCMYSRTWRNSYLKDLRDMAQKGGKIRFLLPLPNEGKNPSFKIMANRIGETTEKLRVSILETYEEINRLSNSGKNNVEVHFTTSYINHSLYLYESGGVLGLYSYRSDRSPTPALRLRVGPIYRQVLADYEYLWDTSINNINA
jgi:hypothetical protein